MYEGVKVNKIFNYSFIDELVKILDTHRSKGKNAEG